MRRRLLAAAAVLALAGGAAAAVVDPTPAYPDGFGTPVGYINVNPFFQWREGAGGLSGSMIDIQVDDSGDSFPSPLATVSTPTALTVDLVHSGGAFLPTGLGLTPGVTYYWRVRHSGSPTNWSAAAWFSMDSSAPSGTAPLVTTSTGTALAEGTSSYLAAGFSAQLTVTDSFSGLAVSTEALAIGGDGNSGPGATAGWGVIYSTDAGSSWTHWESTAIVQPVAGINVQTAAVFKGHLYVGDASGMGRLFRYDGANWTTLSLGGGFPASGESIQSLSVHQGFLYAGTAGGRVYASSNGTGWAATNGGSAIGTGSSIVSLVSYNGRLHAGAADGKVYATIGGGSWLGTNEGNAISYPIAGVSIWAMAVYNGRLYAVQDDKVYVSTGHSWNVTQGDVGLGSGASDVIALAEYDGHLYAALTNGAVFKTSGESWSQTNGGTAVSPGQTLTAMTAFNGKLYVMDNAGRMYATPNGEDWARVRPVDASFNTAQAMVPYKGKLYAASSGPGVGIYTPLPATLTGADVSRSAETLAISGLTLAQSTSNTTCGGAYPCAKATNQVLFSVTDTAGNAQPYNYAVVVDTNNAPYPGCDVVRRVGEGQTYPTISAAVAALPKGAVGHRCVAVYDDGPYAENVEIEGFSTFGSSTTIFALPDPVSGLRATVNPTIGGAAFTVRSASVNIAGFQVSLPAFPGGGAVYSGSAAVTVSNLAVNGGTAWADGAIRVSSASRVLGSTANVSGTALWLDGTDSVAELGRFVGHVGVYFSTGASRNELRRVMAESSALFAVQLTSAARSNLIRDSLATGTGGGGIHVGRGADANTVSLSTASAMTSSWRALIVEGAANSIVDSRLENLFGGVAELVNGAHHNAVVRSTVAGSNGSGIGVFLSGAPMNTLADSYVRATEPVYASAAHGLAVRGSALHGNSTALQVLGGDGLTVTSSTLRGLGLSGKGISLSNNTGLVVISSNALSGHYGIDLQVHGTPSGVWITSNVVTPVLNAGSFGVYLNDADGATVEGNDFFYRVNSGLGGTHYALYSSDSDALKIRRNRFNQPGVISNGDYRAIQLDSSNGSLVEHNDSHMKGIADDGTHLYLQNSPNTAVTGNVFVTSVTVGFGVWRMIEAMGTSSTGLSSDYNAFFSSSDVQPVAFGCDASIYQYASTWTCSGVQDRHSIMANPLWAGLAAGEEDFHPKSAGGRWEPSSQSFVLDAVTSPSLDLANPAEDDSSEPAPRGSQANLGSYGGTAEASKTPAQPCAVTRRVCRSGLCPFTRVQDAFDAGVTNPLDGHTCVVVEDDGTYPERVVIEGFTHNGSSLALTAAAGVRPHLRSPYSGTAALEVRTASVTVSGVSVEPSAGSYQYLVLAASSNVTLDGLVMGPYSGTVGSAVVALSTAGSLSRSSAAALGGATAALLTGLGPRVESSTATSQSGSWAMRVVSTGAVIADSFIAAASGAGLEVLGSSACSVDRSTVNGGGYGVSLIQSGYIRVSSASISGASHALWVFYSDRNELSWSTATATGAGSVAAYLRAASSNAFSGSYLRSLQGNGVYAHQGSNWNAFSGSTITANVSGASSAGLYLDASSSNTFTGGLVTNPPGHGVFLDRATDNVISFSTVQVNSVTQPAMYLTGSSSNTVRGSVVHNASGDALYFYSRSNGNAVVGSSATAGTGGRALYSYLSSTNAFVGSYLKAGGSDIAMQLDSGTHDLRLFFSTVVTAGTNGAVYAVGSQGGLYEDSTLRGGAFLSSDASFNRFTRVTFDGVAGTNAALEMVTASSNTVTDSVLVHPASPVLKIGGGSSARGNVIQRSTISASGAQPVVLLDGARDTEIVDSVIANPAGPGARLINASNASGFLRVEIVAGSTAAAVSGTHDSYFSRSTLRSIVKAGLVVEDSGPAYVHRSTVTGSTYGVWAVRSASTTLWDAYVQGSTAAYVQGSSATWISSTSLAAVGAGASALLWEGSAGLRVSSSVAMGGALGWGLNLRLGTRDVVLSSNAVLAGARYGVHVGSHAADGTVWIASNTVGATVSASTSTAGILLDALPGGATVHYNDVVHAGAGAVNTPQMTYALLAVGVQGAVLHNNRFRSAGAVTGGGYAGAGFLGSPAATLKYNDFYATGAARMPQSLLLHASPDASLRGNVFWNGMSATAGGSFAYQVVVDAASQPGFSSDYNDFAAGTVGRWGIQNKASLDAWQALGLDAHSLAQDPLWKDPAGGDFHPKSAATTGGRYDPALGSFQTDAVTSPTIDRGDPADSVGDENDPIHWEPVPNGTRVNMGSYAGTSQASKAAPPAGCALERTVSSGGPPFYSSIQAAVDSLPNPLTADTCVVIRENIVYAEEVRVPASGTLDTAGHRLTIQGDPNMVPRPVVDPGSQPTAAFVIRAASVTVANLQVRPTDAVPYGVYTSSAYVFLEDVLVEPGTGGSFSSAAVRLSSEAVVLRSSVNVTGAHGLLISGLGGRVQDSTATTSGAGVYALYLPAGSSVSVTGVVAVNAAGVGARLSHGTTGARVSGSTVTGTTAGLELDGAHSNTITGNVLTASGGAGAAALSLAASTGNAVLHQYIDGGAADALVLGPGAHRNAISHSTFTSSGFALRAQGASSNTVTGAALTGSGSIAVSLSTGTGNVLDRSTVTAAGEALRLYNAALTTVSGSYLSAGTGDGLYAADGSSHVLVAQSTIAAVGAGAAGARLDVAHSTVTGGVVLAPAGTGVYLGPAARGAALEEATISALLGVRVEDAQGPSLRRSSVTASDTAVTLLRTSSATVEGCAVTGSSAVHVSGSTLTFVTGSSLTATGSLGAALALRGGGGGLLVSASVVRGGSGFAGVFLDTGTQGLIVLSSNAFPAGARGAVYAAGTTPGARLWITRNTIELTATASFDTYGVYLDVLTGGATVQDNALYHRFAGAMGSNVSYGLYARGSAGLRAERNRLSNPGMLSGGSYQAILLAGSPRAQVAFNDLNASGSNLLSLGVLLALADSPDSIVKNNAFSSDLSDAASWATLSVDAPSQSGFRSDYNSYHSTAAAPLILWAGSPFAFPWTADVGGGRDANSIESAPSWRSVMPGEEDFRLVSQKDGDDWTSGLIDRAEPAESFSDEPAPNGSRANIGSYGGTASAARTPDAPGAPSVFSIGSNAASISFTPSGAASYTVRSSSVADHSSSVSLSAGAASPVAVSGLSPNTTYYFTVGATWGDLFVRNASTAVASTLPDAPAPGAPAARFPTVHVGTVAVSWLPGGNPLGVTTYTVVLATSPVYAPGDAFAAEVSTRPGGSPPTATIEGLLPNTLYHAHAAALNHAGSTSAYVNVGSTVTRVAPPGGAATTFHDVSSMTVAVGWDASLNPLDRTTYTVVASTHAGYVPGDAGVLLSTRPAAGPSALLAGLTPSTTYFVSVRSVDHSGAVTAYVQLSSAVTLSAGPGSLSIDDAQETEMTVSWSDAVNGAGTLYRLDTAAGPDFSGSFVSSYTYNTAETRTGLTPNTTHSFRVAAVNPDASLSAFTALSSGATRAAAPVLDGTPFLSVHPSSMVVAWGAGGNPLAITSYTVTASTASDFSLWAASVTVTTAPAAASPLSAAITGLSAYTTYYVRVRAINHEGVPTAYLSLTSAATLAPVLTAPGSPAVTGAGESVLSASWGLVPGATSYELAAALDGANPPSAPVAQASVEGLNSLSGSLSGLAPNTTHYVFVRAVTTGAAGPYAQFAATATAPAAPLAAATPFAAVTSVSMTVNWEAGGNPVGTTYYLEVSAEADFDPATALSTTTVSDPPFAALVGLSPYVEYFVRARAVGRPGDVFSSFADLGSRRTAPAVVATPGQTAAVASASTTLTVNWAPAVGASSYTVVASTEEGAAPASIAGSSETFSAAATTVTVGGLTPNTTHFLFVRAHGPGATTAWQVFAATATRPAPPAVSTAPFPLVFETSAAVAWLPGGNPVGVTTFTVTLTTGGVFPNSIAENSAATYLSEVSSPAVVLGALQPDTTYHLYVSAYAHDGSSVAALLASSATLARAPESAASTFSAVAITSMTVHWASAGNPDDTLYRVQLSTDAGFGAVSASTVTAGSSWHVKTLQFSTTYHLRVQAVNRAGIGSPYALLGSTLTQISDQFPLIVDAQDGDGTWRRTNTASYAVTFQDASGSQLSKVQVRTSLTPGDATDSGWVDTLVNINEDTRSTPLSLLPATFDGMTDGATNYVTVRVHNGLGNTTTLIDAFYVLKDTTPPSLVDNQPNDGIVRSSSGTKYAVEAADAAGGLAAFQYSVSLSPGLGDASLVGWTTVSDSSGAYSFATPWELDFAALRDGATNYVSVRAYDAAGSATTLVDAFTVLKDTSGPTVTISSPSLPSGSTGYLSALGPIAGTAAGAFGVRGTEVSVRDESSGLYWSGTAFNSPGQVWLAAPGATSWSLTPVTRADLQDGGLYRVVARSSNTSGGYSTRYATATFVFDLSTPTVSVAVPVPDSTVASVTSISGSADDDPGPGGRAAGVASVEVRLRRNSDGLWWNWVAESWGTLAVSSVAGSGTSWSVSPTTQLQANLVSGSSYFIAVRASDGASPANAGDFTLQGATFTYSNATKPNPVADLAAASGGSPGRVSLTWTATGRHGAAGTVSLGEYRVHYSTVSGFTASTAAAQVAFSTAGVAAGAAQGYTVTGLNAGATYYFALALQNQDGTWSDFSNEAQASAAPAPFNAITGHVVNASSEGITAVQIDCWDSADALVGTAFTLADGSGTFQVTDLAPGTYKLQASWTANGVTSSVWQDGISMGSSDVDFSLEINYALATLTGTLGALGPTGAGSRVAAGSSRVELFQRGRRVSEARPTGSGRWTIPGLLPGRYSVRAFTGLEYTDFQEVELAEGEVKTVGFVFDPLPEKAVFAFPNPARHSATIRFETALQPLEAQIVIFDLAGRLVREIPGSQVVAQPTAGLYHAVWDLTNSQGQAVASGVYFFMVKAKGGSENQLVKVIKKLAVVR